MKITNDDLCPVKDKTLIQLWDHVLNQATDLAVVQVWNQVRNQVRNRVWDHVRRQIYGNN